jgi:uncharacterized protein (TIGR03437 family)
MNKAVNIIAFALPLFLSPHSRAQTPVATTPDSWTMGAPMPTPRNIPFTGVIGQKVYVVGGVNASGFLNVNEVYDTTSNSWTTAAPMPTVRGGGAGAVVNNILYIIGGGVTGGGNTVNTVEAYDPSTDTWSAKAPVPISINSINAVVSGGIIYIVGGFSNGARLNDVFSYNPATDSWSKLASLQVGKSGSALGLFGGQIVSAGGLAGSGTTADAESYSIADNAWTKLAPLPGARQTSCFGAFAGTLYLAGGDAGANGPLLNTTIAYNEPANAWQSGLSVIPTGPGGRSASVGGLLYCFGGASTGEIEGTTTYYDSVQIYQPELSPAISPNGVISASAFGGFTQIAPGSWIEIYGSNLAAGTQGWTQADFTGNTAPTSLGQTSVTIGGASAFLDYVSPTQIDALVPSDVSMGSQPLVVTNAIGASNSYTVTVNDAQPGILAPAPFDIGGLQYAVATFSDGSYALPTGALPGVNSRPAMPGDVIVLYGVGFGPVTPNIPAGQLVQELNNLTLPFTLSIGGVPATVLYSGLAPKATGLYQFNVTVPDVPTGNPALAFTLNGVLGTQTVALCVGN